MSIAFPDEDEQQAIARLAGRRRRRPRRAPVPRSPARQLQARPHRSACSRDGTEGERAAQDAHRIASRPLGRSSRCVSSFAASSTACRWRWSTPASSRSCAWATSRTATSSSTTSSTCRCPRHAIAPYLVRRGDVLFNRTNSQELVGKSGRVPASTSRRCSPPTSSALVPRRRSDRPVLPRARC